MMGFAVRRIRYVSLVNLLLDSPAVVELLGPYLTANRLYAELARIEDDCADRRAMLAEYERMRTILGAPGAPERAADAIVRFLKNK